MKKLFLTICLVNFFITAVRAQEIQDSIITLHMVNNNWVNELKHTGFTYDADCHVTYELISLWNTATNTWQQYEQNTSSYNSAGKIISEIEQHWDTASSVWDFSALVSWTYDGSNYLLTRTFKLWDTSSLSYDNYQQVVYANNTDGTAHIETDMQWSNPNWDTLQRVSYVYNSPGQLDTSLTEIWSAPGVWYKQQRYIYVYNVSNVRIQRISQGWSSGTSSWSLSQTMTYMPGFPLQDSDYIYSWSGSRWDTTMDKWNYHACTATGVPITSNNAQVKIYPNPAHDLLTLQMDKNAYNTFTITNEIGQQLIQQSISGTKTNIDIATLPAGMYYISLRGDNGMRTEKFVKM